MKKAEGADLFRQALEAGSRRDYESAAEILTRIVSETDEFPQALLYLGRSLHSLGDFGKAIGAFRLYLRASGDAAEGWFFLGRTYLAASRPLESARCLRRALELGAEGAETWALLGLAALRLHKSKASVEALERAVTMAPGNSRIFRGYLNALFVHSVRILNRGEADMARQMLSFVISNGLDGVPQRLWRSRAYRELRLIPEALADCRAALSENPRDPGLLTLEALLLLANGNPEDAAAAEIRLRSLWPDTAGVSWTEESLERYRAVALLKEGDWTGALRAAVGILRKNGPDAGMRALAAEACRGLGRFDRASEHLTRALELDPGNPDLLFERAVCRWRLADFKEALADFGRARRAGANADAVEYWSVLCRCRLGQGGPAVLESLQRMLRLRPADPELMFALGEALYREGRPDLARGWFDRTFDADPGQEMAALYRISCRESMDDRDASFSAYSDYLAKWPDNSSIRRDYVGALMAARRYEEAASAIEEGIPYERPGASDHAALAACYRNAGRYREAGTLYRSLLRASPRSEELLLGLTLCLEKSGAYPEAVELLEKGAPYVGASGPWSALGILHARKGRAEPALAAFRKAAELDPQDPKPLRNMARIYEKTGLADLARKYKARAESLEGKTKLPGSLAKPRR